MSKKYLYGASVQGIQGFIMKTNDLKPIIGASELVDRICTSMFDEYAPRNGTPTIENIVRAAGNIKVIFTEKEECERAFREFPKKVMMAAPGITISQAVVVFEADQYGEAVDKLEERLRAERNKPVRPLYPGVIGMARAPKTGEPAVTERGAVEDKEYVDYATSRKLDVLSKGKGYGQDYSNLVMRAFGREVDDLLIDNDQLAQGCGWLAVVHADGNGFGEIVLKLGRDRELFPKLSVKIDECTQGAFQKAFEEIYPADEASGQYGIRPLVLSGDDVTFICRADIAVPFVKSFLFHFEEKTKDELAELAKQIKDAETQELLSRGLTACAGIAFMKPSYPFHYAYDLAESLCHAAKVDAKQIKAAPSCLMFYKIQDSIISDWKVMAARELDYSGGSYLFGPYYLNKQEGNVLESRWTIDRLESYVQLLKEKNSMRTSLRRWVSAMYADKGKAEQLKKRYCLLNPADEDVFDMLTDTKDGRCPAYDLLTMLVMTKNV